MRLHHDNHANGWNDERATPHEKKTSVFARSSYILGNGRTKRKADPEDERYRLLPAESALLSFDQTLLVLFAPALLSLDPIPLSSKRTIAQA